MTDRDIRQELQQLREQVEEAKKFDKRAHTELERKRIAVNESRTKYMRLNLENDLLDVNYDVLCARRGNNSKRGALHWDQVESEMVTKMSEMEALLGAIDAEKKDQRVILAQYFRSQTDLPINFSSEAMALKAIEKQKEIDEVNKFIQEQEKEMEEEKAIWAAEQALLQAKNDQMDAFAKDVKSAIIAFRALMSRRKDIVPK